MDRCALMMSTRILGRRTAPFTPFLIPSCVPHGFTQDPSTDQRGALFCRRAGEALRKAAAVARGAHVRAVGQGVRGVAEVDGVLVALAVGALVAHGLHLGARALLHHGRREGARLARHL